MARQIEFTQLSASATEKILGKAKRYSAKFPKKSIPRKVATSGIKRLQTTAKQKSPKVKLASIKGIQLNRSIVGRLRAIHTSPVPTAEAIIGQKMNPEEILGSLYSSFTALEFTRMQGEFKRRSKIARTPLQKKKLAAEWNAIVNAGGMAYLASGLKRVDEAALVKQAKELQAVKANFNTIVTIYNSGLASSGSTAKLTPSTVAVGGWVTAVATFDPGSVSTTIGDLCSKPFAEGVFSKHFSKSFNLRVTLKVWCPTWSNPFRTCNKTFTLAGISFSFSINVGYRVNCCGATAWGQASAQACGTLLGVTVCAGCTGSITGVAGIGRTGSGSTCTYGIGINALLKCTFAGVTVFQAQAPFGYNVSGPCPPAGLCK